MLYLLSYDHHVAASLPGTNRITTNHSGRSRTMSAIGNERHLAGDLAVGEVAKCPCRLA